MANDRAQKDAYLVDDDAREHHVNDIVDDDDEDDLSEEEQAPGYDAEDSDDPVVNEFDVYMTEPSKSALYILQFIGRNENQHFTGESAPTELRIKPESGYVEVDVPLNIHTSYDRLKGVKFGESLRKTKGFGQTAYGAAAGFERTMPRSTKRPGAAAATADADADGDDPGEERGATVDDNIDEYVNNFEDANDKGHVLNTVTWGGRLMPQEEWKPKYMIGVFRGKELHLTPIAGFVQLRPELHHIDAVNHVEAAQRRREPTDAKDVIPISKRTTDQQSSAELFKEAANERWIKMKWNDSESPAAYEARETRLFLPDVENAQVIDFESVKGYVDRVLPKVVGKDDKDGVSKGKPRAGSSKSRQGADDDRCLPSLIERLRGRRCSPEEESPKGELLEKKSPGEEHNSASEDEFCEELERRLLQSIAEQ